ncbi:HD domain-containing protein [Candidatus Woesearchaeota archaeon]|nr:HD domain-containing protein [Candidatus Woesearchaeota archaeon]
MDQTIRKLYQLKNIERANRVKDRQESSAEHTWSCLMLADYFLTKHKMKLDRLHVYELLMYHDVVEIEAGDVPIHHNRDDKHDKEMKALDKLKNEIPVELRAKLVALFTEFEEEKTKEARFAKAIDKLDATLHELDYPADWKGWTEPKVRKYNDKYFEGFPEIQKLHDELLKYVKAKGYYDG